MTGNEDLVDTTDIPGKGNNGTFSSCNISVTINFKSEKYMSSLPRIRMVEQAASTTYHV